MAIPGQYNIGQRAYDIDPAFTDVLYSPLQLNSFNKGFGPAQATVPQAVAPAAPAADVPATEGYIPNDGRGEGAGRQAGRDPNSGLSTRGDVNFDQGSWWGGNYTPDVSMMDAVKGYGPMLAGGLKTGLMGGPGAAMMGAGGAVLGALKGMRLDPINDKVFQDQLGGYLEQKAPDVTVEDFKAAYRQVVDNNWNSKLNAEDTIRGLAMGYDPEYRDAYRTAVTQHNMRPDEFAGWVDTVNSYNATNPAMALGVNSFNEPLGVSTLGSPTSSYNTNFSPAYNFAKTYGFFNDGMNAQQAETVDRLNKSYERRATFNERVAALGNQLGLDLDNGMRSGGNGGMGSLGATQGDTSNAGTHGDVAGHSRGDGGERGGIGGGGRDGDRDGDSSNNGNGRND
jgi:hypothetical protein